MSHQKKLPWVTSSFDGFVSSNNHDKKRKRQRTQKHEQTLFRNNSNDLNVALWVDLHSPTTRDDLAVHKKKIQEVEAWLVESLAGVRGRQYLLVTGPSGSAKTTTIQVLAREAGLSVVEWINPTTNTYTHRSDDFRFDPLDSVAEISLCDKFQQFFSRAVKFKSVCGQPKQNGNVILIEDLPNSILRKTQEFHNILRQHKNSCRNPVIFIVTDSPNHHSNVKTLFPQDIQTELSIVNIVFNPIAISFLTKALSRIITIENYKGLPLPSKDDLHNFADTSNGDIRSAVNALQFACRKDISKLPDLFSDSTKKTSKSTKRKNKTTSKDVNETTISIGSKDPTLLLFRALGKVLYCKRNEEGTKDELPTHLHEYQRTPLLENPESIYNHGTLPANSFTLFLHQNCSSFYNDVESLSNTLDLFTDADVMQSNWNGRDLLSEYAASISIRGVMLHTSGNTGKLGWKPLTKPYWYTANNKITQQTSEVKDLCKSDPQTVEQLTTTIIPYLHLIKPQDMKPLHYKLCHFQNCTNSMASEKISEMDIDVESISDSTSLSTYDPALSNVHTSQAECVDKDDDDDPEEEFLIEEFDD